MLVTERFVFVHLPKTGGSFIKEVALRHFRTNDTGLGTHAPWKDLPEQYKGLPGFYVVRNPWDWYVSWYEYIRDRFDEQAGPRDPDKRHVWRETFREGEAGFAEAVTAAIDLYPGYFASLPGPGFTPIRFETLRKGVISYYRDLGLLTPPLRRDLRDSGPVRSSKRGKYRGYYDDELRQLVGEACRDIVALHDYTF